MIPKPKGRPFSLSTRPACTIPDASLKFPESRKQEHKCAVIRAPNDFQGTSGVASTRFVGACVAKVAVQTVRAAIRVAIRSSKSAIQAAESISDGVALATALPAGQLEVLPVSGRNWQNFLPEAGLPSTAQAQDA
jgi:hypothetical protein